MVEGQILWLIIDIVIGLAILGAVVLFAVILIVGRTGSTSKKPKKEKSRKS